MKFKIGCLGLLLGLMSSPAFAANEEPCSVCHGPGGVGSKLVELPGTASLTVLDVDKFNFAKKVHRQCEQPLTIWSQKIAKLNNFDTAKAQFLNDNMNMTECKALYALLANPDDVRQKAEALRNANKFITSNLAKRNEAKPALAKAATDAAATAATTANP